MRRNNAVALAVFAALVSGRSFADNDGGAPAAVASDSASDVSTIIVTGTRASDVRASDSPAPVAVVTADELVQTGVTNLAQAIGLLAPSLNARSFGGDTSNLTLTARLRGLSGNATLVLINGKRRHPTANLSVGQSDFQGSAAADLDLIPIAAIDHIEILQDGAAVQYGSDAIAGVINIILKHAGEGGSVTTSGGQYFDGGGQSRNVSGTIGFSPSENSFLDLSGEVRGHDHSDRSGPDLRLTTAAGQTPISGVPNVATWASIPGYPHLNHILGDAYYETKIFAFNAGVSLESGVELYAFGTYGHKNAASLENYRLPNRLPTIWPLGFSPQETLREDDHALTAGVRGDAFGGWNWDLSSTYGRDSDYIDVVNSGNVSLFQATGGTPKNFNVGQFIGSQWTNNFDVTRQFDLGLTAPLTLALGLEQRRETYEIVAGDAASRYGAGSQSYPGFSLTDAGSHSRNNVGGYVDVSFRPVDRLTIDAAGRVEHYSDFGSAEIGKLTARYDFSDAVAVRGTVSNGFRAPTLAEEYYSATNVSPTSANVQLPPNSSAAKLIGVQNLKDEKSQNISLGLVVKPVPAFHASLDAYQIKITNRVIGSGVIYGRGGAINSPAVTSAIAANGNTIDPTVTFVGVQFFSNGADTRTRGVEFALDYESLLGDAGSIRWAASANYGSTDVTKLIATPTQIQPQVLFDKVAVSLLETAAPRYKAVVSATYSWSILTIDLHERFFGNASEYTTPDGGAHYYVDSSGKAALTDLDVSVDVIKNLRFSVGAINLFNKYPQKNPTASLGSPGIAIYPTFSPYGFNGGYWYAKAKLSF
jgi:iron complex outermembrane receptor protein